MQRAGIPIWDANAVITGVGGRQTGLATKRTILYLITTRFSVKISALVLRNINLTLPPINTQRENWEHLDRLTLADPEFDRAKRIDMILGADIYGDLILNGVRHGRSNEPVAQKTALG